MTPEKKTDLKVGLTVLVGLALLFFGIAWAKGLQFGADKDTVKAHFTTSGGLEVGDPVTINGIKMGVVRTVDLLDSGVDVVLAFQQPVRLKRDASASIMMLEVMGGKKVEISSGFSKELLPPNTTIPGGFGGDIGTLVSSITPLTGALGSIIIKVDTLLTALNTIVADTGFTDDVKVTIKEARKTLTDAGDLVRRLDGLVKENGPMFTKTLKDADDLATELNATLKEDRPALHGLLDSGALALKDVRHSLHNADAVLTSVDSLLATAHDKSTLLYRLTKDPTFGQRFDSLLSEVTKLANQLRTQGLDANIRFFQSSNPIK